MSDKNFHGTIPTLVLPDGTVMVESVAITLYLAELYSFLPPVDKRADYYRYILVSPIILYVIHNFKRKCGQSIGTVFQRTRVRVPVEMNVVIVCQTKAKIILYFHARELHLKNNSTKKRAVKKFKVHK